MLNLKRSWKQSLAAVALLTGAGAPVQPAVAASASAPETTPASTSEAAPPETAPGPQAKPAPPTNEQLYRRYGLRTPAAAPAADPAQEAFMRRYGLRPGSSLPTEKPGARLEAKLRQIVLPTLTFDGMPLTEVLKNLDDQSRKLDPDKAGVNFLINRNFPPSAFSPRIDPTSGLPVPAAPEAIDMSVVAISIPMPLRNISLKDALDAITKVADRPIEYSIEDYAVVFSPKPEAQAEGAFARREPPAPAQLVVRTFKVDTNTFAAGLENAFGIKFELPAAARAADRSRVIQRALRDLLTQLAVSMDNSKTVFYNELTGVIMVRATPDDLEVVRAAIETLGGSEYQAGAYAQANGFGGGPGPALRPGETRP